MNYMNIFNNVAPYIIFLLIGVSLIAIIMLYFIYKYLKEHHPLVYQNMGSPGIFSNNGISENTAVTAFIFKREYKRLNDAGLNKLCSFVFYCGIFNIVVCGLLVTSFIVVQAV